MYNLSCVDGFKYKGGDQTYVLDIIPTASGLAATSSDQRLCLFDPLRLSQGPLKSLQTNHGNLTSAKVYSPGESVIATAGENGTISFWDLRLDPSNAQALQIGAPGTLPPLLSLACSSQSNSLAAGTEFANHQASIIIWDIRTPTAPRLQYNEVHSDDVTELTYHPTSPHLLLSGSTDGLVNVCDTTIADEDEVVVTAFNHGSVHRAGFLPASSSSAETTEIYALSHDEKLALYDAADGAAATMLDVGDVRPVLGCQYAAGVRAKVQGGAVLGVGSQDQEMFALWHLAKGASGWGLDKDTVVGLPGAHGGELVRSFCFVDEEQLVFTAGEDGCVKAWRPGN